MEKLLVGAEREVLVEVVRLVQKQALSGSEGSWKDFLNVHDKKLGSSLSDPAKRSTDVLAAFLKTFTPKDLKFFGKIFTRSKHHKAMKQFIREFPDQETPQQRLVHMTIQHPQYKQRYSFPFVDQEWVMIPLGKISKALTSNSIIAIDCEKVLCEDGSEAVVKICAVDENLVVKIDHLVKPDKVIADYRTSITGISAKDLDGVTCSLANIQKSLKKLTSGKILAGHTLCSDLSVLKVDHPRVIDTTHIFKCEDMPITYSPSLTNLCKSVLGLELRRDGEPHNCLNDALAVMMLVRAKLDHGFEAPLAIGAKEVSENDLTKLLIHKIPLDVPCQELLKLFSGIYNVFFEDRISTRGQYYSTYAVFKNFSEATDAFGSIKGPEYKDSFGMRQKQTTFKLSTGRFVRLYVRRMLIEGPIASHDLSNRPPTQDGIRESGCNTGDALSRKRPLKEGNMCLQQCTHAKEAERLKRELHQRDDEIFDLQKVVSGYETLEFLSRKRPCKEENMCLQHCRLAEEAKRLKREIHEREDEIFDLQKTVASLLN